MSEDQAPREDHVDNRRFRALVENGSGAMVLVGPDARVVYASR